MNKSKFSKSFFTSDDMSAYEEMASFENVRVKPNNPKKFDWNFTVEEEALPSPISTQYQEGDSITSPVIMSPFSEKFGHKKSVESSFIGNNCAEDIFDDELSEVIEQASEVSEQSTSKFDERKENMIRKLALKCKYDWKKVANKFNKTYKMNCTPVELKDKYKNLHKPNITLRIKFTPEEDMTIARCFEKFGSDWAQIATYFPTRTAVMVKNRYYSFVRKSDLLSNDSTGASDDQDEQFSNVSISVNEKSSQEESRNEENSISEEFVYRVKNLFEENPQAFYRYPVFDMDTCLLSELCEKISPVNY